eukprot:10183825-Alexandrium_andersonii.AAC.1
MWLTRGMKSWRFLKPGGVAQAACRLAAEGQQRGITHRFAAAACDSSPGVQQRTTTKRRDYSA